MKTVRRIILTGAESSGKTSLARALGERFHVPVAEEYARTYLEEHGPEYDAAALLEMSRLHIDWQRSVIPPETPLGIYDTDLINYKIWSEEVFGQCPDEILAALARETHHLYLVCAPDLPWTPDPLRESPDRLDYLFQRHLAEIQQLGRPYAIVRGSGDARFHSAEVAFETFRAVELTR